MGNHLIKVGIVNLEMGNIASVVNAIDYCGVDTEVINVSNVEAYERQFNEVSHLILPGVGHFETASVRAQQPELRERVVQWVANGKPLLGICLGMQLLFESSEETQVNHQSVQGQNSVKDRMPKGFGIIPGTVRRMSGEAKLPHIGWNRVDFSQQHPVFEKLKTDKDYYFVHSYALLDTRSEWTLATSNYNGEFVSAVAYGSAVGVQFHPEKSQRNGLQLLENFCYWDGKRELGAC